MNGIGAGNYPYTVELYNQVESTAENAFGHKTLANRLRGRCAARVWTTSNAATSRDAGELVTHTPRLELLEPLSGVDVNWQLKWKERMYTIVATEEREFNLVVTLARV